MPHCPWNSKCNRLVCSCSQACCRKLCCTCPKLAADTKQTVHRWVLQMRTLSRSRWVHPAVSESTSPHSHRGCWVWGQWGRLLSPPVWWEPELYHILCVLEKEKWRTNIAKYCTRYMYMCRRCNWYVHILLVRYCQLCYFRFVHSLTSNIIVLLRSTQVT